jgi:cholesterol transport system auxiliary component
MTLPLPHLRARWLASAALFLLVAGCGILSDPPQRVLYRLHPEVAFAAPLPRVAAQLVVATPTAPAGLDTVRIALSRTPQSLDYFAGVQWADRVVFLVQDALVEGFEKSAAIPAVGGTRSGLRADFFLETAISDFTAVYEAAGPPRVAVKLTVKLVRAGDRQIVDQHAVAREATAAGNTLPEIVVAFDKALGGAVAEVVGWTLGNRALAGSGRR